MQQHDIHDKETLDALVDGSSARYHELMKIIKDAEEKMAQNKVLKTHIINYAKTRDTYIAYRKSGYSKKFYEAHRDEIILHKAAKEAFSKLPDGKIPKVKELNEEFTRLLSEKKAAYGEYKKIKKEMRDYQIAKQNVESFYATQQTWNQDEDLKNEATAAKINLRAIIKMKLGGCPLFAIPAKQECISTHKVRAQLGIEDDILRGLGMCLQQAKCAHVRTRALLANLRKIMIGTEKERVLGNYK